MRNPKGEMKASLKKGAWSLEEDRKLISYINRYGIWNWSHMPKFAGLLRSGKSCRLRWMNYLKPDLKKGSFSEDEERSILHFHSILGNRWSAIARKLPGRSDNEIKNYWHTHLKKHVKNNPGPKKLMQKDTNMLPCSEARNIKKIKEHVNDDDNTNFLFSWASEDDNPSSSSNNIPTISSDQQVEFCDDIGSPGTVEDLQCFWRELLPLEDMEIGNINQEILIQDHIFQGSSFHDPINSWSFYYNEYEMINNI